MPGTCLKALFVAFPISLVVSSNCEVPLGQGEELTTKPCAESGLEPGQCGSGIAAPPPPPPPVFHCVRGRGWWHGALEMLIGEEPAIRSPLL